MSITSANAVLTLSITNLYPVPQQIQGFSSDDIYGVDPIEVAETMMGVDGVLTGGFVNTPTTIAYTLMADSPSRVIFETWWLNSRRNQDIYTANGEIRLPSLGHKWALVNGILVNVPPIADGGKTLKPTRWTVRWQAANPSPI